MKAAASLFLVGFMGAGKSSVGKALAPRLGLPFADLDELVTAAKGRTPGQIIGGQGEPAFRRIEVETLRGAPHPAVVALGGGAFLTPEIRHLIAERGRSLFLDWPFAALWPRIDGDAGRPLAGDRAATEALHGRRRPTYLAADWVWRPQGTRPPALSEVIDQVEVLLRAEGFGGEGRV